MLKIDIRNIKCFTLIMMFIYKYSYVYTQFYTYSIYRTEYSFKRENPLGICINICKFRGIEIFNYLKYKT